MKCQILFFGKNKKNIAICLLLKILPRVLSVNLKPVAFDIMQTANEKYFHFSLKKGSGISFRLVSE